jgi:hypothetical protein
MPPPSPLAITSFSGVVKLIGQRLDNIRKNLAYFSNPMGGIFRFQLYSVNPSHFSDKKGAPWGSNRYLIEGDKE